jgi:GNAT superfamily N-acetyltransferase
MNSPEPSQAEPAVRIGLIAREELAIILPLVGILNPGIAAAALAERLAEMAARGFACAGIWAGADLVGCCGLWEGAKFYCGRYLEPDNVVIHPGWRSRGLGEALDRWLVAEARRRGCAALALDCYVSNQGGNAFWHRQGYRILGFHYKRDIPAAGPGADRR